MIKLGSVNEKTTFSIVIDFADEEGQPVTPLGGTYRIDTETGTSVRVSTPFTPTSYTHRIALTVADNTLVDSALKIEKHIITITWQYGVDKQGTEEMSYMIKNLSYV